MRSSRWRLLAALPLLLWGRPTAAQPSTLEAPVLTIRVPNESYYAAIVALHSGSLRDALHRFEDEARGGVKTSHGSFVDSICYHAMAGEAYYRLGDTARALERFNTALRLSTVFPQWLLNIRFDQSAVRRWTPTVRPPWGQSSRQPSMVRIKEGLPFAVGNINQNNTFQQGGVVRQAQYWSVDAVEIVRCMALALRRRTEILGPISSMDPLSKQMVALLQQGGARPNHWSEALVDLQHGLALVGVGDFEQAEQALTRAATLLGKEDYTLSSIALLELGKLARRKGNFTAAGQLFLEASYSAFHYEHWGVAEEALTRGLQVHLAAGGEGFYAPLGLAAKWPKLRRQYRLLGIAVALGAAENLALTGDLDAAGRSLNEAGKTLLGRGRRDLRGSRFEARYHWIAALLQFKQRNVEAGLAAVDAAVAIQQRASSRQYQIFLVRQAFGGGEQISGITARRTVELYKQLLGDPTHQDWAISPLDALTSLMVPQDEAYGVYLAAAANRKEVELTWQIADQYRRRVFFRSLPLGGRLLALRTLLESPASKLSPHQAVQREDLLVQFPAYKQTALQITELRNELIAAGFRDELRQQQQEQLRQLAELGASQEEWLHEMAVRRFPAAHVFPPPLGDLEAARASLAPGQAVLAFYHAGDVYQGLLLNRDRYATWTTSTAQEVHQALSEFLRALGNHGANVELSWEELGNASWRKAGDQLLQLIVDRDQVDLGQDIEELIVVPAGSLWYLPFEALPLGGPTEETLLKRMRLRYVPTLSLATVRPSHPPVPGKLQVVAGQMYGRKEVLDAATVVSSLQQQDPSTSALPADLVAPVAAVRSIVDRLLVWNDIPIEAGEPYGWSPIPGRTRRQRIDLFDWTALPGGHPRLLVLPGYHTAAEQGLRPGRSQLVSGEEIFLPITALMAGGTHTILLSRWRTAGQTSLDLTREFVQELPYTSASDAWRRSVQVTASSPLDSSMEPRLKKHPEGAPQQTAEHPFFWSGYLLADIAGDLPEAAAEDGADVNIRGELGAAP